MTDTDRTSPPSVSLADLAGSVAHAADRLSDCLGEFEFDPTCCAELAEALGTAQYELDAALGLIDAPSAAGVSARWSARWKALAYHEREGRRSAEAGIGDCLGAICRLTAERDAARATLDARPPDADAMCSTCRHPRHMAEDCGACIGLSTCPEGAPFPSDDEASAR